MTNNEREKVEMVNHVTQMITSGSFEETIRRLCNEKKALSYDKEKKALSYDKYRAT